VKKRESVPTYSVTRPCAGVHRARQY